MPLWQVLKEGIDASDESVLVQLPEDKSCNNCVLQWLWEAVEDGGHYVQCADMAITADGTPAPLPRLATALSLGPLLDPPAANGGCAGLLPVPDCNTILAATDNNNNGLPDGSSSPPPQCPCSEDTVLALDLGQTIGLAVGCSLAVVLLVAQTLGLFVLKHGRRKGPSATKEAASGVQLKAETQAM